MHMWEAQQWPSAQMRRYMKQIFVSCSVRAYNHVIIHAYVKELTGHEH